MNKKLAIILASVMIFIFVVIWFQFLSGPRIDVGQPVVVVFVDAEPNIVATQGDIIPGSAQLRDTVNDNAVIEVLFRDTDFLIEVADSITGVHYNKQIYKAEIIKAATNGGAVIAVDSIPRKTARDIIRAINR
ncbi:hypothetical protein [Dethiobacter alkaliphilus]|uniref:Uncharacterized protein n=1 Tax=Dethiobacter alkaliphilus AHT 1 TaxID=555088 RepID=C0GI09_DETAL|nr:hypothetical protein [Dethiobacter alkaliphilus]EEG77083.1 hypothetical protein DealDRAFT_2118 [Dethiobacter alkaliphilus AHT 1]